MIDMSISIKSVHLRTVTKYPKADDHSSSGGFVVIKELHYFMLVKLKQIPLVMKSQIIVPTTTSIYIPRAVEMA